MASPSPPRGRSPARSATPTSARRVPSSHHSRSPTARRSPSPRSGSRSYSRSPPLRDGRNGHGRARSNGVSTSRSRSPSRGDRRSYRDRSYTRSPSRESRRAQSSKIVVEKLTKNVTEAHLREIFGSYGRIESIDLPLNKQSYILYDHPTGSEAAIAHMHEAQLDGMVISPGPQDQLHHLRATDLLHGDHLVHDIAAHHQEEEALEELHATDGIFQVTFATETTEAVSVLFKITIEKPSKTSPTIGSESTTQKEKKSKLQFQEQL
ncbi:hypothetical protein LTS17_002784 [Exophiala oligosperma]